MPADGVNRHVGQHGIEVRVRAVCTGANRYLNAQTQPLFAAHHMLYSGKLLKGGYIRDETGEYSRLGILKGNTRSLDYSSYDLRWAV